MRKRTVSVLIVLSILLVCLTLNVSAGNTGSILVNEEPVSAEVKNINGEVYVPLKVIEENLAVNADYDEDSGTLKLTSKEGSVASVIEKVGPSVVGIVGKLKPSNSALAPKGSNMAFGTGVIIRSNGYIVTNAHVVKDMETIMVVLTNGKAYQARVKAMDEDIDLALVKIDKGMLKPAVFGDISDIQIGEQVIAIGTPLSLSLRNSVTKGIISGLNRTIQSNYKFIQSDVAINGGNSGGPLVDMEGKVIGINSIKYVGYGVEGMTFSIPVDTINYALDHFMNYGEIRRAYLGTEFTESIAAKYGLPSGEGITVDDIEKDAPAELKDPDKPETGLMINDEVIALNGTAITSVVDLNEEMKKCLPGDSVEFTVKRKGSVLRVNIVLGEIPDDK